MKELIAYQPSKWGTEFHSLECWEALGAGAAGPGKSVVLLWEPLAQIKVEDQRWRLPKDHEHYVPRGESAGWALHLRRTYKQLARTIWRANIAFPRLDPGARWDAENMTWIFTSGYRYQFGHCKDPDSWETYFSQDYSIILFDELVQFEQEQYEMIASRCRSGDPVLMKMLKVRAMSNPLVRRVDDGGDFTVSNPFWVRDYFVDPAPKGKTLLRRTFTDPDTGEDIIRERIYLPAKLSDNPDPAFVKQYKATLLSMREHQKKALYEGDWYATAGAYYSEFWRSDLHVVRAYKIPRHYRFFRSCDWGFKKHGCVHWWAVDDDGNLICVRELSFKGKFIDEVSERIREIEQELGLWSRSKGPGGRSLITGPADTQLWEKRGEGGKVARGKTKAQEFQDHGVPWRQADKASRAHNALLFCRRLEDHADGYDTPGIVFFEDCTEAIKTIPGIPTDPNDDDAPMDGGPDHWHDSVLYACAYASREGRLGTPPGVDEEEDDADFDQDRGQTGYGSTL